MSNNLVTGTPFISGRILTDCFAIESVIPTLLLKYLDNQWSIARCLIECFGGLCPSCTREIVGYFDLGILNTRYIRVVVLFDDAGQPYLRSIRGRGYKGGFPTQIETNEHKAMFMFTLPLMPISGETISNARELSLFVHNVSSLHKVNSDLFTTPSEIESRAQDYAEFLINGRLSDSIDYTIDYSIEPPAMPLVTGDVFTPLGAWSTIDKMNSIRDTSGKSKKLDLDKLGYRLG